MDNLHDFDELPSINFFSEEVDLPLRAEKATEEWIVAAMREEQKTWSTINFIFCNDSYLHKINVQYLDHDTYTDVITFPYSEDPIEGDIYISVDRIKENAERYEVTFDRELHRVIIHGVLHLIGYGDKTNPEKERMTAAENHYLQMLVL